MENTRILWTSKLWLFTENAYCTEKCHVDEKSQRGPRDDETVDCHDFDVVLQGPVQDGVGQEQRESEADFLSWFHRNEKDERGQEAEGYQGNYEIVEDGDKVALRVEWHNHCPVPNFIEINVVELPSRVVSVIVESENGAIVV